MKNKLPRHWILKHGAYYYRPPTRYRHLFDKGWVKLGRFLAEAHRTFASLPIHADTNIRFISQLADRYELECVPLKAPRNQDNNLRALKEIRTAFGSIPIDKLEPRHCTKYYKARGETRTARITIEVLSSMFTAAVAEWGYLNLHPFKGQLRLKKGKPRTRYVTDEEFIQFRSLANDKLKAYLDLKIITGLSKEDILCIERSDITEIGLHAYRRKTRSKPKVYPYDEEDVLETVLSAVKRTHHGHIGSTRLFHTREGNPYYEVNDDGYALHKPAAFDSMWQRTMTKYVASGGERFHEHDLRAKSASDTNLEHAQQLLDHANARTTDLIYRRKTKSVPIADLPEQGGAS